jgi:hypothetical protein
MILIKPKESRTRDFNALRLVVSSILIVFACSGASLAFQAPGGRGDAPINKPSKPKSAQPTSGTGNQGTPTAVKKKTAVASRQGTLKTSGQRNTGTSSRKNEKQNSPSSVKQSAPVNNPPSSTRVSLSAPIRRGLKSCSTVSSTSRGTRMGIWS